MEYITFKSGSKHQLKPSMFLLYPKTDGEEVNMSVYLEDNKRKLHKIADSKVLMRPEPEGATIECKMPKVKKPQEYQVLVYIEGSVSVSQATKGVVLIP